MDLIQNEDCAADSCAISPTAFLFLKWITSCATFCFCFVLFCFCFFWNTKEIGTELKRPAPDLPLLSST